MGKTESMSIEASEWIGHGTGRLIRRNALSASHPESWPSLWLKKYGSLDGFPNKENLSIQGATHNGDIYFKCSHCDCINVVGNAEVGIF